MNTGNGDSARDHVRLLIESPLNNDIPATSQKQSHLQNATSFSASYTQHTIETLQEGQHPLTGQRAPPISGGT